ncbi:uncharacterized protein LOC127248613 isoform X2 [Andrographis paniculata]|uniref:uncharacterized protein LOC127248613 isoform X2 n=1 Tax=Andrographis paniculata TaxID=175694 RepID=UPI0021E8C0CD|nr:uncharacterized protein LOC127248613 isoform X2 [Andrographis paniculata]
MEAMERGIEEDAADRRRESAIASAASLRPNFKPRRGLSEAQLSKFQELHKRRLQIKAKSKAHKRAKDDGKSKLQKNTMEGESVNDQEPSESSGDPGNGDHSVLEKRVKDHSSFMEGQEDNGDLATARRRQKLYWGLDTKERWERKSNM